MPDKKASSNPKSGGRGSTTKTKGEMKNYTQGKGGRGLCLNTSSLQSVKSQEPTLVGGTRGKGGGPAIYGAGT